MLTEIVMMVGIELKAVITKLELSYYNYNNHVTKIMIELNQDIRSKNIY